MFSTPHGSSFDAELKELPHRIKSIKEKNIELHKSLMQNFSDGKCTEKERNSFFWDEKEAHAVEMLHKKVLEISKTYRKNERKLNCDLEDNAIKNNLTMRKCSISSSSDVLEIPLVSNVNNCFKDSSIEKKQHSEKRKKPNNFSDNQNYEVVEIIGNNDILSLPMMNNIEDRNEQNLYSCSDVKTLIHTKINTVKCEPQMVSRNISIKNVNMEGNKSNNSYKNNMFDSSVGNLFNLATESNFFNPCKENLSCELDYFINSSKQFKTLKDALTSDENLKYKHDAGFKNINQDVIYLSNVNTSSNVKNKNGTLHSNESAVGTDKINCISKDDKQCNKLKSKLDTNFEQDVIYLDNENPISNVGKRNYKLLTNKNKVKSNCLSKDNKVCKKLKFKHNNNFDQDVIYLDNVNPSFNVEKTKSKLLMNKNRVIKDECNSIRRDNKERNKFKSKLDTKIDQDVIYLGKENLSLNVEKKKDKLLANKYIVESKYEDNKHLKQKYAKFDARNEVAVISSNLNINKRTNNDSYDASNIHNSSEIFNISNDSNKENISNVTVVRKFENLVFKSDAQKFHDGTDYSSKLQSFKKISGKPAEYTVPHLDFEEVPVDFPIPFLHTLGTVSFSSEKMEELKSQGVSVKNGLFSKEEETQLRKNLRDFQSQFKIYNTRLLLGIGRQLPFFSSEFGQIKRFLRAKHFYERLGKDINSRTLHSIYAKARRLFSPFKKKLGNKSATADEVAQILKLQKQYGNKWILIGQILGLNPYVCSGVFSYYNKRFVSGKWSEKEIEYLVSAIKGVVKSPELLENNLLKGKWKKIAELVPSRNSKQCYNFWNINYKQLKEKFF